MIWYVLDFSVELINCSNFDMVFVVWLGLKSYFIYIFDLYRIFVLFSLGNDFSFTFIFIFEWFLFFIWGLLGFIFFSSCSLVFFFGGRFNRRYFWRCVYRFNINILSCILFMNLDIV